MDKSSLLRAPVSVNTATIRHTFFKCKDFYPNIQYVGYFLDLMKLISLTSTVVHDGLLFIAVLNVCRGEGGWGGWGVRSQATNSTVWDVFCLQTKWKVD